MGRTSVLGVGGRVHVFRASTGPSPVRADNALTKSRWLAVHHNYTCTHAASMNLVPQQFLWS